MRSGFALFIALAALWAGADNADAQRRRFQPQYGENVPYDGRFAFTFVRLRFEPAGFGCTAGGRACWDHDYPRAETHFGQILNEITMVRPYMEGSNIISIGDPELMKYPLAYMSEPGFWTMTDDERENLRNYVLKGGFIIFDDFAGPSQGANFATRVRELLPGLNLVQLDVTHPIFDSFFHIESLDYQHPYYNVRSEFFGVFEDNDPEKRLLLIANFNNDIGEYWEFSDTGFLPIDLSNEAYKIGVNYIVYSMTH